MTAERLARRSVRQRLIWAFASVLLIACGATAAWFVVQHNESHNDCGVVEKLGRDWVAMSQSITVLENGSGERQDLIAIADKESSMSDTIRTAAGSVSDPALKDQLTKWAQATALLANSQRNATNFPAPSGRPPAQDADYYQAAVTTHEATQALVKACPKMPQVPPVR